MNKLSRVLRYSLHESQSCGCDVTHKSYMFYRRPHWRIYRQTVQHNNRHWETLCSAFSFSWSCFHQLYCSHLNWMLLSAWSRFISTCQTRLCCLLHTVLSPGVINATTAFQIMMHLCCCKFTPRLGWINCSTPPLLTIDLFLSLFQSDWIYAITTLFGGIHFHLDMLRSEVKRPLWMIGTNGCRRFFGFLCYILS